MSDPFDLQRFVTAQDSVWQQALSELTAGRKRSHWMWFVFPQLAELGHSATAKRFGISGADEAAAYANHPVLGPRLHECARLVVAVEDRSAEQIFGYPDYLKLRSSMTLFAECASDPGDFDAVLDRFAGEYPDGRTDVTTERLLGG